MARVLIDCDGVLCDLMGFFRDEVSRTNSSREIPRVFPHCYDIRKACKDAGLSSDRAVEGLKTHGASCSRPYEGAAEFVRTLRFNHDVRIVTSPWVGAPDWYRQRVDWLKWHFGIDERHVIFAVDKTYIEGDYLIEDSAEKLEAWSCRYGKDGAILIDRPWNREGYGLRRARSYQQVLDYINL